MNKNTLTWIGIALIVIISGIAGACIKGYFTPKCPQIRSDTIVITKLDTVKYAVKTFVYGGKEVHTDTIIVNHHDTSYIARQFEKSNDTIWVYNQYYSTQKDSIILTDNPDLWFKLNYGISENRLIQAQGQYVNKRPVQQINNNPIQPLKAQLYLGVKLDGLSMGFGIGGTIVLKDKKDRLWSAGIDYIPILSKQPIYSVGRNFKISF